MTRGENVKKRQLYESAGKVQQRQKTDRYGDPSGSVTPVVEITEAPRHLVVIISVNV